MVSIVLLNWNGKAFLRDCLLSIAAQTCQAYDVVILDDRSTDGSVEFLRQEFPEIRVIQNDRKIGYCGGANRGIQETTGEFVLIMNPDVILAPDFLARVQETMMAQPRVGIVTGKLLRFDRQTIDSTGQCLRPNLTPLERGYNEPDTGQYEQPGPVFSACGAAVVYRRAMLDDIQLDGAVFDEAYFAYFEDLDVGWRAQIQGWQAYYTPAAVAYHYRGGGQADSRQPASWIERLPGVPRVSFLRKPPFIQRHVIKNRYLTLIKNASFADIWRGLPAILAYEIMLWGYVACTHPRLIGAVAYDMWKLLPAAFANRRRIQARRITTNWHASGKS